MTREPISYKLRFEVLRRDRYTCQYCGRSAPDVILHIDHLVAASQGGPVNIQNLATACSACNAGKSDIVLMPGQLPRIILALPSDLQTELARHQEMAPLARIVIDEVDSYVIHYLTQVVPLLLNAPGLADLLPLRHELARFATHRRPSATDIELRKTTAEFDLAIEPFIQLVSWIESEEKAQFSQFAGTHISEFCRTHAYCRHPEHCEYVGEPFVPRYLARACRTCAANESFGGQL